MIIQIDQYRNVSIVRCRGRMVCGIDCETVRSAVYLQQSLNIILDLTAVDTIDAAGLGLLVEVMLWARAMGRPFVILNPNPRVQNTIRRTALDQVLPVWQTRLGFDSRNVVAAQMARSFSGKSVSESSLDYGRSCGSVISA